MEKQQLKYDCAKCKDTRRFHHYVQCEKCLTWYHSKCLGLIPRNLENDEPYYCGCDRPDIPHQSETPPNAASSEDTAVSILRQANPDLPIDQEELNESENANPNPTNSGDQKQHPTRRPSILEEVIRINQNLEEEPESSSDSDSDTETDETDSGTDIEGYAGVRTIKDWRQTTRGREFLVVFMKNRETMWLQEANLDGCLDVLHEFCNNKGLTRSNLAYRSKCGAPSNVEANEKNWASIEEILKMVQIYGDKKGIQAEIFSGLGPSDSLSLLQIGSHCFTVLYLSDEETCYVADGGNTFISDTKTERLVRLRLTRAKEVRGLKFDGQKQLDQCASSAAGIAIELQRLYKSKKFTSEVKVPSSIMDRIRRKLHKEPSKAMRPEAPINQIQWRATCPKCGYQARSKSRAALNFHKC